MHKFRISEHLQDILTKLSKKDNKLYRQLMKKIEEVINSYDIEHYKNLRYNLKNSKRVHVGHFVLVFQYDKSKDEVNFDDFDHHDDIYNR